MKAITLRNLPGPLARRIEKEAAVSGASLNKTVIRLLLRATGIAEPTPGEVRHHDLDHLAGSWSADEAAEFDQALAEQRQIDPELWRER